MLNRRSLLVMAVLVASACSRDNAPTSSEFTGPQVGLGSTGSAKIQARGDGPVPGNCTFTLGFWKTHPNAWPVDTLTLGGVTYSKAEAIAILQTPPRGDVTYILIHQLIAATLNVANGADSSAVSAELAAADAFLVAHHLGSKPGGDARDEGTALAAALDDFNNGVTGPGHCGEAGPTATPTASPSPTATRTVPPA